MTEAAIFPLGSVLFPHMPLALRLFEPRYLVMLGRLLEQSAAEFGVVLIERGQEVGGGEQRFVGGTMAELVQVESHEGFLSVLARGTRRFRVDRWLADDPYPRAEVTVLPDLLWADELTPRRMAAEAEVRRALAEVSEFRSAWPADVELSDDPIAACWQIAALAPVGELDHYQLLQSQTVGELLGTTVELAAAARESLALGWTDPPGMAGEE